jgi:tRNA-guanine family transglycosylase
MGDELNKFKFSFTVNVQCRVTKARTGYMRVIHHNIETPVFMPVGTQVKNINFFIT